MHILPMWDCKKKAKKLTSWLKLQTCRKPSTASPSPPPSIASLNMHRTTRFHSPRRNPAPGCRLDKKLRGPIVWLVKTWEYVNPTEQIAGQLMGLSSTATTKKHQGKSRSHEREKTLQARSPNCQSKSEPQKPQCCNRQWQYLSFASAGQPGL